MFDFVQIEVTLLRRSRSAMLTKRIRATLAINPIAKRRRVSNEMQSAKSPDEIARFDQIKKPSPNFIRGFGCIASAHDHIGDPRRASHFALYMTVMRRT